MDNLDFRDHIHLDTDDREWTKGDTLWNRIEARAVKEKTSYWEVCRKVIVEYWNDHGLTKDPEFSEKYPKKVYWKEKE
ncbi:MAG: hypothetical protein PVI90_15495 [Desulfobacteraceae bacterium]